jgi:hypothetical protein
MYHEILLTIPDMLGKYSDATYIEQAISEASNTFEVFDNFE